MSCTKPIQLQLIIVYLVTFSLANSVSNALVSISTGAAALYIIFDCFRKKSLGGFDAPVYIWKCILCFLGSILVASIASGDIPSIKLAWNYIYWSTPFLLLSYLCVDSRVKNIVMYAMITSVLFTSGYSIYQFYIKPVGSRIGGFYYNPNFFAVLLILVLPFLILLFYANLNKKNYQVTSIITLSAIISGIFALYLTGSRGAMLGFILGSVFLSVLYGVKKRQFKTLFITLIVIIGVGFIVSFGNNVGGLSRSYDMERVYLLESSYNMWNDNKVIGVGLNNWKDEYQKKYILPEAKDRKLVIPHNVVAWFFSATGIIGGVGFLCFALGTLLFLMRMMNNQPNNFFFMAMVWAFVAFSIHGLVDVGITMKSSNRLFFALLGITVASLKWTWCRDVDLK